ncbi:MAG: nucleotidyltransferase family protein [Acidobacteriota bacterium]
MEAIILAGGLGTRLAPRVSGLPKAMAPVAGRPFLEILLRQLDRCGCTRAILAVGYLHAAIEDHFGAAFGGLRLDYSVEGAPLGTGGAIRNALVLAREEAALVLNGDTYLDADYAAMLRMHRAEGRPMTIAIVHQPDIARYGGVLVRERRIAGFEEKGRSGPGWINAGAYVLSREFPWPAEHADKFSIEKDVLAPGVGRLQPTAFPVEGFFLDIGVPEDYDRAQTALAGI